MGVVGGVGGCERERIGAAGLDNDAGSQPGDDADDDHHDRQLDERECLDRRSVVTSAKHVHSSAILPVSAVTRTVLVAPSDDIVTVPSLERSTAQPVYGWP